MQGVHMSYERVLLPVSGKHSGERALKALSQARKLDPSQTRSTNKSIIP